MAVHIHMEQLSPTGVTRRRGAEAFARLRAYLEQGAVDLSLLNIELVSASFLDEIVRQAAALGAAEKLTFITDQKSVVGKLERISSIRGARVFVQSPGDPARRLLEPRTVRNEAKFSREKVPA